MFIQVQEFEEDTADNDDLFYIATDDDISGGGDTELEEEDFSLDELQQLDSKFVSDPSLTKFPLGCNIWYNARTSSSSRGVSSKNSLKAKSATVTGVYMHLEKLQKVYKLKSDTAATTTSTTQCETFLYEDRLVYGMNCPVTVTDSFNSEIVSDGVIVCPRLHGEHQKHQQQVSSYDVQILHGNGVITVEFGVAADRIKYRLENTTCAESKFKGEGDKKGSVVVKEVKEEVVDVSAKGNDEAELALKLSVQQPDSSTAQQSAATASGAVTKAVDNNIDPDDYWSW